MGFRQSARGINIFTLAALLLASPLAARTRKTHRHPPVSAKTKGRIRSRKGGAVPQRLVLASASVLVQDQQSGAALVEKAPDAVLPIASITKLMTVMVVLDAHQDQDEMLTIGMEDTDTLRHSRSRLPVGTRLTRREAIKLALMSSENRAAHALGRTYPGGLQACVLAMNTKAQVLGLGHTRFKDPAGLDEGNVSCARDLARLLRTAYGYSDIRQDTTDPETELQSGRRTLHFINTSRLVRGGKWAIGLSKTGFVEEAGHCLVMQAKLASRQVFIILLNGAGKLTPFGDADRIRRWIEVQ